jgi:hypothetical protein
MKQISNAELAKAAASILISLDDMEHLSATDKIAILKSAANILENQLTAEYLGHALRNALPPR